MDTRVEFVEYEDLKHGDMITWGTKAFAFPFRLLRDGRVYIKPEGYDLVRKVPHVQGYKDPGAVPKGTHVYRVLMDEPEASGGYPDDNPKTAIGTTKPPLHCLPPVALFHVGQAMADGEAKYGLMNWREHKVTASVYFDAAMRHLMSWWDGEDRASDSGVHHLAHAMACMGILLDAESLGQLNDNRPKPGNLPAFIQANTKDK